MSKPVLEAVIEEIQETTLVTKTIADRLETIAVIHQIAEDKLFLPIGYLFKVGGRKPACPVSGFLMK